MGSKIQVNLCWQIENKIDEIIGLLATEQRVISI